MHHAESSQASSRATGRAAAALQPHAANAADALAASGPGAAAARVRLNRRSGRYRRRRRGDRLLWLLV